MKKYFILAIVVLIAGLIYFNQNNEQGNEAINEIKKMINTKQEEEVIKAQKGDIVSVHYTGKLEDGTVFDSSISRGQPIQFVLGSGQVIPGWDQGILDMKIGEEKDLIIPPELAYGDDGVTDPSGKAIIPPKSTLYFTVELVDIQKTVEENEVSN